MSFKDFKKCLQYLNVLEKDALTNFLGQQLLQKCKKENDHCDPYQVVANIQGVSYLHSWLIPVLLDLLIILGQCRVGLKIKCLGLKSLSLFESHILH